MAARASAKLLICLLLALASATFVHAQDHSPLTLEKGRGGYVLTDERGQEYTVAEFRQRVASLPEGPGADAAQRSLDQMDANTKTANVLAFPAGFLLGYGVVHAALTDPAVGGAVAGAGVALYVPAFLVHRAANRHLAAAVENYNEAVAPDPETINPQ